MKSTKIIISIIVAILIANLSKAQFQTPNNWDWQFPKLFEGNFTSIAKVSDGLITVGSRSSIVKSKDGGVTWKQITIKTEEDFISVEFLSDEKTGYLFAKNGNVYKSTNSGDSWTVDNSFPSTSSLNYSANLYQDTIALYFKDNSNNATYCATITGGSSWKTTKLKGIFTGGKYPYHWHVRSMYQNKDTIYRYNDPIIITPYFNSSIVDILELKKSKQLVVFTTGDHHNFSIDKGIYTDLYTNGYSGGGKNFAYDESTWYSINPFQKTTDAGKTWTNLGGQTRINDICFIDEFEAFAACSQAQIITTVNGGSLWTNTLAAQSLEFTEDIDKYRVNLETITIKGNVLYGCGYSFSQSFSGSGHKYVVMKSMDFGKSWIKLKQYSNSEIPLYSSYVRKFIVFNDSNFIILRNNKQKMKNFELNGSTGIIAQSSNASSFIEYHYANNDKSVTGFETYYGEKTSSSYACICDIHAIDNKNFLALGYDKDIAKADKPNSIFKITFDSKGAIENRTIVGAISSSTYLNVMSFASDNKTGFVAGAGGKILRTKDGGETWDDASVAGVRINNIQCIDKDTAFVVSNNGGFFRTYNGSDLSVTWTAKSTKTFDSLHKIQFFNGKVGFVMTNNQILNTFDGGNSFQKMKIPFDFIGSYDTTVDVTVISTSPYVASYKYTKLGRLTGNIVAFDKSLSSFCYVNDRKVLTFGNGSISNGIEDISENSTSRNILAIPNPVHLNGEFVLSSEKYKSGRLLIFDIKGKQIKSIDNYEIGNKICLQQNPGIYFIKFIASKDASLPINLKMIIE